MKRILSRLVAPALLLASISLTVRSEEPADAADLALQLSNPVSSLISVPILYNYDGNIGPDDDGSRSTILLQPVVPIGLNEDWNLISRTILPLVDQEDLFPGAGSQRGLGDTVQSLFFSPVEASAGGWIWGVGPVLLLPTATDDLLGNDKWGAGPTGVALKQDGPWTYGFLANHIWSFAGNGKRSDVSTTFMQPFASYTTEDAWSFAVQTETTYDWESSEWTVPVAFLVSKVTTIGGQLVQLTGGPRYYVQSADGAPEGFGFRLGLTLLFPR